MAGYADVMRGIVNEATEDVLDVVCGAYMCNVDVGNKVDEPAIITIENKKYGSKRLLGKDVKVVTYDIAVYSCNEERARQGKKSWLCVNKVPSALGLLENEIDSIKTEEDAKTKVSTMLAAGFESAVGMVIKSMDKMSDADEQRFKEDIVTNDELMEEMFGDMTKWDDDEDEDEGEDEYDD